MNISSFLQASFMHVLVRIRVFVNRGQHEMVGTTNFSLFTSLRLQSGQVGAKNHVVSVKSQPN